MCGIIGYTGGEDALPIIARGLRRLEYRGYDSVGMALVEDTLRIHKGSGAIGDLALPPNSSATCGIGHTRWATHGMPTRINAHPHIDCTSTVAVVHNGIISNYGDIRRRLTDHRFISETDTEVIAHLVEDALQRVETPSEAVEAAIDQLEGSFAIGVVVTGFDGIIAARRNSPLVVGHGDGYNLIASDVAALLEHTDRVSYLRDGEIAVVTPDSVTVADDGAVVDPEITVIDWERSAADKGAYEHYMLKEIHEQPQALRQTLAGRIAPEHGTVDLGMTLPEATLRSIEEIQLVACGTSYHACLYARCLLRQFADVRVTAEVASEYEFYGGDPDRTLVIGVSQSGETADTLRAIRKANAAGALTLALTNTLGSTITREVDDTVYIRAGPEISVAATKTFAAQVAALALFTAALTTIRDPYGSTRRSVRDLVRDLEALPGAIQQVLDREAAIRTVAETYASSSAYFFIGRHAGYPVALESALKLKEISYDHAEGFPAGELKHGPLALVSPETPVFAILTRGTRPDETLSNVKEVQSRGAPVIGCVSDAVDPVAATLDGSFEVPACGTLEPLVANVYLQLFAYHVANLNGQTIDKPRNLAKSVTVE